MTPHGSPGNCNAAKSRALFLEGILIRKNSLMKIEEWMFWLAFPTTCFYQNDRPRLGAMSLSFSTGASNASADGGGSDAGFGWHKPSSGNTDMKRRVPSGFAVFPGDIEGIARKNDGAGCAGGYEC